MKNYRLFAICLALLLHVPCYSEVVSEAEAMNVAKRFLGVSQQQAGAVKRLKGKECDAYGAQDASYYIFTGADGTGWVIVSADDIARPVLGYSVDGCIGDDSGLPDAMQELMDDITSQVRQARADGLSQSEEVRRMWAEATMGQTMRLLETASWNQGAPFNGQCPMEGSKQCKVGCVPTAYAILMRYYKYPAAGRGQTEAYVVDTNSVNVAARDLNHKYDWDNMPMEYKSGQYTADQADEVARLMADIGAALQVEYGADATSGTLRLPQLFINFDYYPGQTYYKDSMSVENWYGLLRSELDSSRPVIYRASEDEGVGHAFILDGYTEDNFFHVNWGWGGRYNGFFALETMIPNVHNYHNEQRAYIPCVPMSDYTLPRVASMDGLECPTLPIAIAAAGKGAKTITVLCDTQENGTLRIKEDQDITFQLNGKKIELTNIIDNNGTLRIADSGTEGGFYKHSGNNAIINNRGTLIIDGGVFINDAELTEEKDYRRCIYAYEGSKTHINGGTFSCQGLQTLCIIGSAIIEDGTFLHGGKSIVLGNYCKNGTLKIIGGTFNNTGTSSAFFSSDDTHTEITGGTFSAQGAITISLRGETIIEDGTFLQGGKSIVLGNYCKNGTLKIMGGTFNNMGTSSAFFSSEDTHTEISGGTFNAQGAITVNLRGETIIEDGEFVCNSNTCVVYNNCKNGTVEIRGGVFRNTATSISDSDYRRALWTSEDSQTQISGGTFCTPGKQTLLFKGNATIRNAIVDNSHESGYGCLAYSGAQVQVEDGMFRAKKPFYQSTDSFIKCFGGLFSDIVQKDFLELGFLCVKNREAATKDKYPYRVSDTPDAIDKPLRWQDNHTEFFDMSGRSLPKPTHGITIVVNANGTTRKEMSY